MKSLGSGQSKRVSRSRASRQGLQLMSEINVTPFVDVMLVLLIIFMITAPMLTVGIEIEIPLYDPYYFIMKNMNISEEEMYKIFNCGIGMVLFVNFENHIRIRDYEELQFLGKVVNRKNKIKRIDIKNTNNI